MKLQTLWRHSSEHTSVIRAGSAPSNCWATSSSIANAWDGPQPQESFSNTLFRRMAISRWKLRAVHERHVDGLRRTGRLRG